MTKRLVDIDDALLDEARRAAGTPTIKATVEEGLRRLVAADTAQRHVRRLRRPGALDVDLVDEARLPRTSVRG